MIAAFAGKTPQIAHGAWVHSLAFVNGDVHLATGVSVFPSAVIRGDIGSIRIGAYSNVQDGVIIHTTHQSAFSTAYHTSIGQYVTLGHGAVLHGCTVGDEVLIGMHATVLDGAVIDDQVMVAAGALVTPRKHLASGYLYAGSPARAVRELTEQERAYFRYSAENYHQLAQQYAREEQMMAFSGHGGACDR